MNSNQKVFVAFVVAGRGVINSHGYKQTELVLRCPAGAKIRNKQQS